MLWDPKMHEYAHFVEFGGPMNNTVGSHKKDQTPNAKCINAIQIHT